MTTPKRNSLTEPTGLRKSRPEPPCRIIKAEELFKGSRSLQLNLDGAVYTLRITRHNKLILHK